MGSQLENVITVRCQRFSDSLKKVMDQHNLTQEDVVAICREKNISMSQGTVSNALKKPESLSYATVQKLCYALDISSETLEKSENNQKQKFVPYQKSFIISPEEYIFQAYLGKYYTVFYHTTGRKDGLLRGELFFEPSSDRQFCNAKLVLDSGDYKQNGDSQEAIMKEYYGQLILSPSSQAAYCYLYSEKYLEICFFTFYIFRLNSQKFQGGFACAVTTSSGSNKRPTMHRILFSRKKIGDPSLNYVKGQLLMNNNEIILSKQRLQDFLSKYGMDCPTFTHRLENLTRNPNCYRIIEEHLTISGMEEAQQDLMLSLLRSFSINPKYNKISLKSEQAFQAIYENEKEQP